ncbi:MAG: tetratricopeptide repeat protein [Bryobacteraceae bacterium]|nr:tetratricopeptide repeat protein [Bryobacteraceae bacterium]
MIRFLRFAVEEALAGRAGNLKEYAIGLAVFDRPPSYDPRIDPLVRVEARRLRDKLKTYYRTDGNADRLFIDFPKGSYAPQFRLRSDSDEPLQEATESTIAVLPFANLSPDPENEYFSDGLTEELIHALTKVEGLKVVAWSSALQLKDKSRDIYEIGRRLRVARVLEGSVRSAGDRLRITVQLIDTATGYYLWSETYDRRMQDLFAVQAEIAGAIGNLLATRLAASRKPEAPRLSQTAIEAYNLYLKGRYLWNKRTAEGMRKSIEYFHQALERDGECALAYAGLADAYLILAHYGLQHPAELVPQGKAAAMKALELDPSLAEAHTSLGFIRSLYDWKWDEAERHYLRAIELNPGYATAHFWYSGDFLVNRGRFDEAFEELKVAMRLDPLSAIVKQSQGYLLFLSRRYQEATAALRQVLEEEPTFYKAHTALGRTLIHMGQYEQAIEALQKGRMFGGDVPSIFGALGQAHALAGNRQEARRILERLSEMARRTYVPCTCFALIHLGLGDRQAALDWLERSAALRELTLAVLGIHPAYDDLRSEPRFAAVLRTIGLA